MTEDERYDVRFGSRLTESNRYHHLFADLLREDSGFHARNTLSGLIEWLDRQKADKRRSHARPVPLRSRTHNRKDTPCLRFANPDNLENELVRPGGNLAHDRKRLTVKLSPDDCETWTHSRIIEAGPSGYSDLAQAQDGAVLCF